MFPNQMFTPFGEELSCDALACPTARISGKTLGFGGSPLIF